MRRITITLGFGLALALSSLAAPARAQFPVFYGGQVLTPFGNRGSDGSYRYPSQAPRRATNYRRGNTSASRYYFAPQGSYYTPYPGKTYYRTQRRGIFRRRR